MHFRSEPHLLLSKVELELLFNRMLDEYDDQIMNTM